MTDSATAARRVAALTLIPTSVAIFGAGLAWANGHDPQIASAPDSKAAAPVADPQLAIAQAKVDDARDTLAQLQAEVNARNVERVTIQEQQAAAPAGTVVAPAAAAAAANTGTVVAKTTTTTAKVTKPVVAAAPAAVPVQTTTKSSTKP
jgi:hypothetical protein